MKLARLGFLQKYEPKEFERKQELVLPITFFELARTSFSRTQNVMHTFNLVSLNRSRRNKTCFVYFLNAVIESVILYRFSIKF